MSPRDQDRHDSFGPQEQRALDALRESVSPPPPSALRERVREQFVRGGSRPAAGSPAPRPGRWIAFSAAAVAAAAAIILLLAPTGRWTVVDTLMPQDMTVNGRPPEMGMLLGASEMRSTPCAEIEVQLGQEIRLRMLGDSHVMLPDAPGRLLRRAPRLEVMQGEVYGTTGGPLGYRFHLETAEAVAVLTGTTFAVFRTEDATCFCLFTGSLEIREKSTGQELELPVGKRVFVYRDGRPSRVEDLDPNEQMKLGMMDDGGMAPLPPAP